MSNVTSTDCRSEVGVTVGLIDGIIAMARVLKTRDQSSKEVQEALEDLRSDEDIGALLGLPGPVEPRASEEEAYQELKDWMVRTKAPANTLILWMTGKQYVEGENPFIGESPQACAKHIKYLRTIPRKLD